MAVVPVPKLNVASLSIFIYSDTLSPIENSPITVPYKNVSSLALEVLATSLPANMLPLVFIYMEYLVSAEEVKLTR